MLEFAMEYLPVLIVGAIIGTFALVFIFAYLALRRRKEEGEDNDRHMADGEIIRRLLHLGITRFRALFKGSRSRSEVVATFLAVLELCKTNSVSLEDDVNGDNPNVRLLETPERKEEPDGI